MPHNGDTSMSIEQATAFLQKLFGSEEMKQKLLSCSTPEERMAFVKESGFEFTGEEFSRAHLEFISKDLNTISGGMWCGYICESENTCGLADGYFNQ
jgi:predicted ribosomally synthesized peptide with nif11-like leader